MRRLFVIILATLAVPLFAARHQSYVSYDAGDNSVIVQGDGKRETTVRVNLPVFPGDELQTGRRGRTEVHLADGNTVALDRNSAIHFQAILDSYESDSERTVLELRYGSAIFQRLSGSQNAVRVDSSVASYVMSRDTTFAVENDGQRGDVVSVYEGSIEVRTPDGSDRVRAGEEVRLDQNGIYSSNSTVSDGTSEFERWFLRRSERYDRRNSRYLDSRLAYADSDLEGHGSWVYVNDYSSWVWRPRVSVGWRPYHYGQWSHSPYGSLVWVSDEPWGWVPYHYGRWAFTPVYGWVWLPGSGYSPAWVYWVAGPSYIGWVPSGWYDCYRPYYDWMYRPYARSGVDIALGFNGRIRLGSVDLNGWTFVHPNTLISTRIDRTALTTDRVRERLSRDGDHAVVTGAPLRLTREQLKNPEAAVGTIARGGFGGGTGKGNSGSLTDLTSFFRRDPELPGTVRERLTRNVPSSGASPGSRGDGTNTLPSRGRDALQRGETTNRPDGVITRGGVTPRTESPREGTIDRRQPADSTTGGGIVRRGVDSSTTPRDDSSGITRRGTKRERDGEGNDTIHRRGNSDGASENWRAPKRSEESSSEPRIRRRETPDAGSGNDARPAPRTERDDTPRRVIDRIGGARVDREEGARTRPVRERTPSPEGRTVDRPRSESTRSETKERSESSRSDAPKKGSTNIKPD